MPDRPEVAEILRSEETTYRKSHGVSAEQARVLRELPLCRTAALGGHKRRCAACGYEEISYNSCRNRHCPKCQGGARAAWLEAQAEDLLEVPYFHVVFTLPDRLGPIALQNPRVVYGLLFQTVAETLLAVARDPRHLGGEIGFLAVLHTWGQTLLLHPHLHCVIPGGGIAQEGRRWISCRQGFFLPVRVLSRVFRGNFLDLLQQGYAAGKLRFHGQLEGLTDPAAWHHLLATVRAKDWVVYAKPPFGGAVQVLKYLARYTHRVAISNQRLLSFADGQVTFTWKDYAHGGRRRTMTLETEEFVRRFLLHVLPKSFVRVRHFGFLANRVRREKLTQIRRLLGAGNRPGKEAREETDRKDRQPAGGGDGARCPHCGQDSLFLVEVLEPLPRRRDSAPFEDTS